MNNDFMTHALLLAKKAYKNGDIPVGCVIVKNNKIISKGYNKKEKNNKVTQHAEIIALEKANKKLKNWRLNDCVLYTTLEPCMMCYGAIVQSRIKKIVYGAKNNDIISREIISVYLTKNKIDLFQSEKKEECESLIKSFFKYKR